MQIFSIPWMSLICNKKYNLITTDIGGGEEIGNQ